MNQHFLNHGVGRVVRFQNTADFFMESGLFRFVRDFEAEILLLLLYRGGQPHARARSQTLSRNQNRVFPQLMAQLVHGFGHCRGDVGFHFHRASVLRLNLPQRADFRARVNLILRYYHS